MVVDSLDFNSLDSKKESAQRRIERFRAQYGEAALEFAQYAAFPLALTTELCYLLRERFTPQLPWYVATDVLLSGLCDSVGYDLYEMNSWTQNELRLNLVGHCNDPQAAQQLLEDIAAFLGRYILQQLQRHGRYRAKDFGYPPHWIALACLNSAEEVTQAIQKDLGQRLAESSDPMDRFRLAAMVESQVDFLAKQGYEALRLTTLRQLVAQLESESPVDDFDEMTLALTHHGFPTLMFEEIEYETISVGPDLEGQDAGQLTCMAPYETVTLDKSGKVIQKSQHQAQSFLETLPEGLSLDMVAISSGCFMMGSPSSELGRDNDEGPQHEVTVPAFFMGKYPITEGQWWCVAQLPNVTQPLETGPASYRESDLPVVEVSWDDAVEFCERLSRVTGRTYQLPSEAQWEYACRAGTHTPFHFGETITGEWGNYDSRQVYQNERPGRSRGKRLSVGQFLPNAFGLYDLHGTVWEWCLDHWQDGYEGAPNDGSAWISRQTSNRVRRGGSWLAYPRNCRSAYRYLNSRDNRINPFGFRVICIAPRT